MTEIQAFLSSPGNNLTTLWARAILCAAYDAMTRRSKLIAINLEDLKLLDDGTERLLIRCSKTDQAWEWHMAYLWRQTIGFLKVWVGGRNRRRAGLSAYYWSRDSDLRQEWQGTDRGVN